MIPFEPDSIIPAQFYARYIRPGTELQGEKRLMLAVLEDGVETYQKYAFAKDLSGRALFSDAIDWFSSRGRRKLFAFESICDVLGIDADYIRRGLWRWREQKGSEKQRPLGPQAA